VGYRPKSRREALLYELCAHSGYCSTVLTVDDLADELGADQIAEMVLRGEGLDPVIDGKQRDQVARTVEDWLFDPRGRGAMSGLPR
jgi:hypothetical protein